MGNIVTRIAGQEDAPELGRLNALCNNSHLPPEHYIARLCDPNCVHTPIITEVNDSVFGHANLRIIKPAFYEETYAELTELFVENKHRRRGIGRASISLAEQLARKAGAQRMIILPEFYNHGALELYNTMGYQHYDIALNKDLGK